VTCESYVDLIFIVSLSEIIQINYLIRVLERRWYEKEVRESADERHCFIKAKIYCRGIEELSECDIVASVFFSLGKNLTIWLFEHKYLAFLVRCQFDPCNRKLFFSIEFN
jgi:hypothetical protein